MTSKEALQELFIRVGGYRDNEEYTTSRVREIIMKDLERLDSPFRPAAELTLESMLKVVAVDEDGVRFFLKGE